MSLQVWLPLNGDLKNQGLDGNTTITGSPSYHTAGKIGKGMNTAGATVSGTSPALNGAKQFTLAFWIIAYEDATSTNTWNQCFQVGTKTSAGAAGSNFRFESCYGSSLRACSFHNNATYSITQSSRIIVQNKGEWHHVCVTCDGTNLYSYRDGVKIYTDTALGGSLTGTFIIGTTNRYLGCINDVRIYDHCLSAKEIKEISRGLILHYPLRGGEGGTNLLKGVATRVTTSAGLTSSGSLEYDTALLPLNSLIGKTFIFSYDYSIEGTKANATGDYSKDRYGAHLILTYKDASGNTGTAYPGAAYLEASGTGRAVQSYTCSSSWTEITALTVALQAYNKPASGNTNTWYLKNFKIELGNVDTGYSINPNTLGITTNYIIDCSGYNYNGTASTVFEHSTDCIRYNIATNFASDKKIYTPVLPTSGLANSYTIAWWAKTSAISGKMFWGFSDGNRLNLYGGIYCNTGDGSSNPFVGVSAPSLNVWHHYAMVGNGSTVGLYVDGVLKGNATTYKSITGTRIYLNGWSSGTDYDFNGLMNDFRIYVTALSAADIKELYQIPISIDKDGNAFAMEFIEDQKPEFHKNGTIENSYIHENEADDSDTLKTFHIDKTKTFANQILEV